MWNRIKKWWSEYLADIEKREKAEWYTYQFKVHLTDKNVISVTEKFKTWYGDEWSGVDSHKEQARRRAVRLGQAGFWQGDMYYPSSNIDHVELICKTK